MAYLLLFKEQLRSLYSKYELFITPVLRFLLAFVSYTLINQKLGFMEGLNKFPVVAGLSFINAFLPVNAIVVVAALFTVLHLYAHSLVCGLLALLMFMALFLLYFRFAPKDGVAVLLMPIAFLLQIPYAVPLCLGLTGNALSAVSVACGVIVYYGVDHLRTQSVSLDDADVELIVGQLKDILDGFIGNRTMRIMVVAFAVAVIVVYLIRRLSINYSWIIAIAAGIVVQLAIIFGGGAMYGVTVAFLPAILGLLLSVCICVLLQIFLFSVDYSKTEYLQFGDDEYYYYVKAVPKLKSGLQEEAETEKSHERSHDTARGEWSKAPAARERKGQPEREAETRERREKAARAAELRERREKAAKAIEAKERKEQSERAAELKERRERAARAAELRERREKAARAAEAHDRKEYNARASQAREKRENRSLEEEKRKRTRA